MKDAIFQQPLADDRYLLEKYPGKGGWTYARIPEIPQNPKSPFGWVRVKGSIDNFPLNQYKLMPMGDGQLFLPVKAAIQKKIGKKQGDSVHVILFPDTSPLEIPTEILQCFQFESSRTYENFLELSEGKQKSYLDWIYNAKTEQTKTKRIVAMIEELQTNT